MRTFFLLVIVAIVTAMTVWFATGFFREMTGKREWSILQALVEANRNTPAKDRVTIRTALASGEYNAIGITSDNGQTVWMLARCYGPPYVKALPLSATEMNRVRITHSDLEKIRGSVRISEEVELFLINSLP